MKKYFRIIAAVLSIACIVAVFSGCGATKTPDGLQYEIADGYAKTIKYTDSTTRTEITVPDEINSIPVTEIADFSLFNSESLEVIHIGKNVSVIGEWSMTNNQRLKEFDVDPENEYFCSVDGVLYTKDMKTIVFYPPAKGIEFNRFGEAQNTTTYNIADTVETVRTKAFYKCYYIDSITIPAGVKTIEEKAFHRTTALTEIKLPEKLEFIGKDAFAYCELITNVTIPASVKEIGDYAFFNCKGIKTVEVLGDMDSMVLGSKWYPTDNGRDIKDLVIE